MSSGGQGGRPLFPSLPPALRSLGSGRLGSGLGGPSSGLDPGLRSALLSAQRAGSGALQPDAFVLPHAARALSAEERDAMFKAFARRRSSKGAAGGGAELDSAMHTESERGESVASESSLLAMMDEGWFTQPAGIKAGAAPVRRPSSRPSSRSASRTSETPQQPSRRSPEPLLLPEGEPAVYAESSGSPASAFAGSWQPAQAAFPPPPTESMYSAASEVPAAGTPSVAWSGWESPRSWSTQLSVPQGQLETMDLPALEQLAAEAAALQQRATLAMQFARQRLGPPTALMAQRPASPGASGGGPAAAADAPSTPAAPPQRRMLPRLALLLAALWELALLLGVGLVLAAASKAQRRALGVLALPARTARAAMRAAVWLWAALLGLLTALVPVQF